MEIIKITSMDLSSVLKATLTPGNRHLTQIYTGNALRGRYMLATDSQDERVTQTVTHIKKEIYGINGKIDAG